MHIKDEIYTSLKKITVFVLGLNLLITANSFGQKNTNPSLEKELNELVVNQSESLGISREEMKIANSIHSFGDIAIPELVKFLKDEDEQVRKRAAYTLSLYNFIDRVYENDLFEALINGELWLAPLVANFKSDVAIQSMIIALKKNNEPESILTNSFKILGSKCIPYLTKIIDCQENCDEELMYAVSHIFELLDKDAIQAIKTLDTLAITKENSISSRVWAIRCLGSIGVYARDVDRDLLYISKNEPDNFATDVMEALNKMKSPLAIDLMLNSLDTTKSSFDKILIIRDISEMGSNAFEAGSSIIKYISDSNWDLRVASARALGYIGYKPAIPELIELLKYEPDWRLTYVSILSLGMLNAHEAIPQLKETKDNHWYSLIREASKQMISNIIDSTPHIIINPNPNFADDFFSYKNAGENIGNCHISKGSEQERLAYLDGFLIGEDHGEWGGTLKYEDSSGNQIELINDNIKSLNIIGKNTIAIAGLAHLGFNKGIIYQILKFDSKIIVKETLILPGAPLAINKLKNNELIITTYGGTVILSKDLKLRQATCSEK
jgi:HEAT repeat protein